MKKKYIVAGMMEWHPIINAGKTSVRISFTGGNLCGGAATPASFETSDPVVQALIENSDYYRSKRIKQATTPRTTVSQGLPKRT